MKVGTLLENSPRKHQLRLKKKQPPILLLINVCIVALVVLGIALLNKSTSLTVEASALNVRTGPGLDFGIAAQVKSGTKLSVLKQENEWYQVTLPDGNTGWVASWLIGNEKNAAVTNLPATVNTADTPLRQEPNDQAEILDTLAKDTSLVITLEQDGWSQVQVADKVGWIPSQYLTQSKTDEVEKPEEKENNTIYTREESTNIRTEPNVQAELVTTLEQNIAVTVLATVGEWYQIETADGTTGYVANWVMNTQTLNNQSLVTSIAEATIMLDAGHGGADDGASTDNNILEKDLTLDTTLLLKKALEKTGARVLLTRDTDEWVDLEERSNMSNEQKPDVFLSLHYDATDDPNIATGTHVFYYYDRDIQLAEIVATQFKNLPLQSHGASYNDLSVTRENTQPALLLELGYMSTESDVTYIATEEYQQQVADLITEALTQYFQ
ncbi:N-acetylmuramoyl-L-alanine amidase [Enterococcus timonensis]|uniref:N-acetylmuramoyl-L-alanine amidase n=1 Tax=Enterococcus timonensis TaxID=1852364 RepID=UPI0008DAAC2B|nr:N-acetylmuramoyl-L-alanine amidase [Enterococcus timonensis]